MTCSYELCRDPNSDMDIVVTREGEEVCLFCYLTHFRGMDPVEAAEISFEGGEEN